MPGSGRTPPPAATDLTAGTGPRIRREYRLRAGAAIIIAAMFAAVAIYGAYGTAAHGDIGVPFLVFGTAGALAQLVLAVAFMIARVAIASDSYHKPSVTRARRSVSFVLVLLAFAVVVGFIAGTATIGSELAVLMAAGLLATFAATVEGWRHLRHLG